MWNLKTSLHVLLPGWVPCEVVHPPAGTAGVGQAGELGCCRDWWAWACLSHRLQCEGHWCVRLCLGWAQLSPHPRISHSPEPRPHLGSEWSGRLLNRTGGWPAPGSPAHPPDPSQYLLTAASAGRLVGCELLLHVGSLVHLLGVEGQAAQWAQWGWHLQAGLEALPTEPAGGTRA